MTCWLVVLNLAFIVGNLVLLIKLRRKNREAVETLQEASRCLREANQLIEQTQGGEAVMFRGPPSSRPV